MQVVAFGPAWMLHWYEIGVPLRARVPDPILALKVKWSLLFESHGQLYWGARYQHRSYQHERVGDLHWSYRLFIDREVIPGVGVGDGVGKV